MGIMKMFRRDPAPSYSTSSIDLESIDGSFNLLKTTAAEVSQAAMDAAKVLQDQLDQSESRFYWTIDSIEDFVLIKDGEGRWQTLNRFGQRLFGFYNNQYVGKTGQQLAEMFPHLKETLDYCQHTDNIAWMTGQSSRSEEKIPYPYGHHYLDMIKTPTFNADGSRKELIIVGRDVSEIHEKSRREKACFQALNSASDAIAIIDNEARIFFSNDQFVSMFHVGQYKAIVGQQLRDVLPKFPQYDEMWNAVQQNQTWTVQCPDTKMYMTILPMMNGQPSPIYYICTFKVGSIDK